MTQTRRMSLLESVTNVVVGYVLAIITQITDAQEKRCKNGAVHK